MPLVTSLPGGVTARTVGRNERPSSMEMRSLLACDTTMFRGFRGFTAMYGSLPMRPTLTSVFISVRSSNGSSSSRRRGFGFAVRGRGGVLFDHGSSRKWDAQLIGDLLEKRWFLAFRVG